MYDALRDLEAALTQPEVEGADGDVARADLRRDRRKGVPEVIFAEPKQPEQVVAIARQFLDHTGRALISRVPPPTLAALEAAFRTDTLWERYPAAQMVILRRPAYQSPRTGGQVGVLTAGTGDVPRAEEATALCREMGCDVHVVYDVGVAGLHRLMGPLRRLLSVPVDAIIVVAGMDGALPSVVAGLVNVPVIGLPTSVGYGMGGKGEAALLSMLQTCAPGLAVVNIDNGIGAGAMAGLIANTVARARTKTGPG